MAARVPQEKADMSVMTEASERLRGYFRPAVDVVRRRVLGANNERIDFIMDSFYKLSPQHQTLALAASAAALGLLVLMFFGIYFARISALESELNQGFQSLQEIRSLSAQYRREKENLDWLTSNVDRKTSNLRPKPFFEQIANQVGVNMEGLRSDEAEIPEDSPLAKNFRLVNIEFRLPKVSVPRMLKFFTEVEKSDQTLTARDVTIRARYGDKLFFDVQAKVSGYKVKGRE